MSSPSAPAGPGVLSQVAHLSRRAGFGLPPAALEALAAGGLAAAIDHYVDYDRLPDLLSLAKPRVNDRSGNTDIAPAQLWWLDRMIRSPRQFEEKMILFWHNLFATSEDKVNRPTFITRASPASAWSYSALASATTHSAMCGRRRGP